MALVCIVVVLGMSWYSRFAVIFEPLLSLQKVQRMYFVHEKQSKANKTNSLPLYKKRFGTTDYTDLRAVANVKLGRQ